MSHHIGARPLKRPDVPAFLALMDALADYERLPRPDAAARERLALDTLSDPPRFQVLLAEQGDRPVAYAVYFFTYSTFLARPTLYVEDVFVLPEHRGAGVGRALMQAMAREAVLRRCGRMEWQVLTWNEQAIGFYEHLGARRLDDWCGYRLQGEEIARLSDPSSCRP